MFGVVPRPLWERHIAPDDRNRIPLALRCLLIEHPDGLVLVDTGAGNKEDAKFVDIYGLDNAGKQGRTKLEDALAELGYQPQDVRLVIDTHLHFDHAGGNTYCENGSDGRRTPGRRPGERDSRPTGRPSDCPTKLSFPNARYAVQRRDLEFARMKNERVRASYFPRNFEPVEFALLDGERELLPGIRCLPTPGHVPGHQSVLVESGGERLCFLGDLVPTAAHVPLPWIMGYDVEPLVTLETKRRLHQRAEAEGWLLVLCHDPAIVGGRLGRAGKGFGLVDPVALR
jgi:glyoxylase-like metal-dependent hydrolase (beta-lactamase superfamily II)